ncbi:hypothetical protein [Mycobacterium heckeshornense]|uniref:hypothetical protein n=1 Tax=Mycobacterium heckeshornense TaxID=110505 RepID=UPI0019455431|nr:hypothetical protein [Mycobacterium heckeshornense]
MTCTSPESTVVEKLLCRCTNLEPDLGPADQDAIAEVVCSLREAGLSVRAIAAATGAGLGTVQREISGVPNGTPDLEPTDGDAIAAQPVAAEPAPTTTLAVVVASAAAPVTEVVETLFVGVTEIMAVI